MNVTLGLAGNYEFVLVMSIIVVAVSMADYYYQTLRKKQEKE